MNLNVLKTFFYIKREKLSKLRDTIPHRRGVVRFNHQGRLVRTLWVAVITSTLLISTFYPSQCHNRIFFILISVHIFIALRKIYGTFLSGFFDIFIRLFMNIKLIYIIIKLHADYMYFDTETNKLISITLMCLYT